MLMINWWCDDYDDDDYHYDDYDDDNNNNDDVDDFDSFESEVRVPPKLWYISCVMLLGMKK